MPPIESERAPLVSVAMTTCNQEPFVEQAVASVLAQEADFPFELVVGDDASSDRTLALLTDYADRFPGAVRLCPRTTTLGPQRNLVETMNACRGRYIALLEGDDYWTSRRKLQRQAAFLESNPQCVLCFHAVTVMFDDGAAAPFVHRPPEGLRDTSTLEDLIRENYIHTCSVMFRAGLVNGFPGWYFAQVAVDWILFLFLAQHGRIGYLDEVMATYRVHSQGVWSGLSRSAQQMALLESYGALRAWSGGRFDRSIRYGQLHRCHVLAMDHLEHGDLHGARKYALKGIRHCPFSARYLADLNVRLLVRLYAPGFFTLVRSLYRSLGRATHRLHSSTPLGDRTEDTGRV